MVTNDIAEAEGESGDDSDDSRGAYKPASCWLPLAVRRWLEYLFTVAVERTVGCGRSAGLPGGPLSCFPALDVSRPGRMHLLRERSPLLAHIAFFLFQLLMSQNLRHQWLDRAHFTFFRC